MVKLCFVLSDNFGRNKGDFHSVLHNEIRVDSNTSDLEEPQERFEAEGEDLCLVHLQDCHCDLQDPGDSFNNEDIPDLCCELWWEPICKPKTFAKYQKKS